MGLKDIRTGEVTYAGKVVRIFWKSNVQFMSDVWGSGQYAEVMETDGTLNEHLISSSEFGQSYEATVDATPEIKLVVLRMQVLADNKEIRAAEQQRLAWIRTEAKRLVKGKFVRVVRGRKVAKGTEGVLIWISQPGESQWGMRVGIRDAKGEVHWTSADNVEVDLEVEMVGSAA